MTLGGATNKSISHSVPHVTPRDGAGERSRTPLPVPLTRKHQLTIAQQEALRYLKSVRGRARLVEMPAVCGQKTIVILAELGLVNCLVGITEKGRKRLQFITEERSKAKIGQGETGVGQ